MRRSDPTSHLPNMYSSCLVCRTAFPENGILQRIPRGDRIAFDLEKGRLWVVCRWCRRWSLVPLESRWEALEELEGLVQGEARLRRKTENIALFSLGTLEVVRVGATDLAEEAWWRYGRTPAPRPALGPWLPPALRRLRMGSLAWVGQGACRRCGFLFLDLPYEDRKILIVTPDENGFSLTRPCPKCKDPSGGGLHLSGLEAELTLARITAFQHLAGESRVTVQAAARLVGDPEEPAALLRLLTSHGKPLGALQPIGLTALEITVTALRERRLLGMEVADLQARWRREEELASLVDGELTPVQGLKGLVRRLRGRG